jgi:hypothetical protein
MPTLHEQMVALSQAVHGLGIRVDDMRAHVDQRMDDTANVQGDRHGENVERLESIDARVRETNGQVARHDEQIRTLFRVLNDLPTPAPDRRADEATTPYTKRDVLIYAAGGASMIGAYKFIAWVIEMLRSVPPLH